MCEKHEKVPGLCFRNLTLQLPAAYRIVPRSNPPPPSRLASVVVRQFAIPKISRHPPMYPQIGSPRIFYLSHFLFFFNSSHPLFPPPPSICCLSCCFSCCCAGGEVRS